MTLYHCQKLYVHGLKIVMREKLDILRTNRFEVNIIYLKGKSFYTVMSFSKVMNDFIVNLK